MATVPVKEWIFSTKIFRSVSFFWLSPVVYKSELAAFKVVQSIRSKLRLMGCQIDHWRECSVLFNFLLCMLTVGNCTIRFLATERTKCKLSSSSWKGENDFVTHKVIVFSFQTLWFVSTKMHFSESDCLCRELEFIALNKMFFNVWCLVYLL